MSDVTFDGACPFLTCLEEGPHSHPVCPDCGAVRWGNLFCPTCREHFHEEAMSRCAAFAELKRREEEDGTD